MKDKIDPDYFRNFIFGIEDSLVSTVGVLFGLSISGEYTSKQLVLTGLVLLAVEALSMGVGSYLTEEELHQLDTENRHKDNPIIGGVIMYLSYFFSGFLALIPYMLLAPSYARYLSVIVSLLILYMAGYIPTKKSKDGIRMVTIAGLAVILGSLVAVLFENLSI